MLLRNFIFISLFITCNAITAMVAPIDPNNLPAVDWTFYSTAFKASNFVYTPFFISGEDYVSYTAGFGSAAGNGFHRITTTIAGTKPVVMTPVIATGPDIANYNYFRAARVAKNGSELWMLVELSGCYTGCDSAAFPKRLGAYRSIDDGFHWTFLGFMTVDGVPYVGLWSAHTGLIYNPNGNSTLDLNDLTKNRFITTAETKSILVSADGINFKSVPMNHPFQRDRLIFTALAKTPYGYHLTSCADWSDTYFTTTVRHLFSKDLKTWVALESNSFLKHPTFYKGVHLSYDDVSKKLWALSPCGSVEGCSFLAWLNPKDFLDTNLKKPQSEISIGEFVFTSGQTAMITNRMPASTGDLYTARLSNGTYISNYKKEQFSFPLANYKRQGCVANDNSQLCVGDAVYVKTYLATIMGFYDQNPQEIKYALKFSDGTVDTGYLRSMLSLPK